MSILKVEADPGNISPFIATEADPGNISPFIATEAHRHKRMLFEHEHLKYFLCHHFK